MKVEPLFVHDLRDAYVSFEGSVLWDGAALVSPSWNTHPPDIERGRSMMQEAHLNEVYVEGVCATTCGPGISVYGHWLVDFLPRLYLLDLLDLLGYDLGALNHVIPASAPPFAFALLGCPTRESFALRSFLERRSLRAVAHSQPFAMGKSDAQGFSMWSANAFLENPSFVAKAVARTEAFYRATGGQSGTKGAERVRAAA